MTADAISKEVVDAAFKVHSTLGPGLLESAYEACLAHELLKRGCQVERQKILPIIFDGVKIDAGYRIDLLINDLLIVELKAVDHVLQIHRAQTMTYLRLSGKTLALLINFNVFLIRDGINRIAMKHPSP